MTKYIKDKATVVKTDTVTAYRSFVRLVEAAALLTVSVYAIYGAYNYEKAKFIFYPLVVAGVVIGLRGAVEFGKYLARKD